MSSINPVSRSMNGIKTIETSEVIFTDDNSSLNTSAGIVQAQANSTTALNGKINSVDFDTNTGVLTLNKEDGGTLTKDLDGRYLESVGVNDIPNLPASKITSGTLATARIPDLPYVETTGDETIDDVKTFSSVPKTTATPSANTDLITKDYADNHYLQTGTAQSSTAHTIFGVKTFNSVVKSNGTPSANTDLITKGYADAEYVNDTTAQTIAGIKTFSSVPKTTATPSANTDLITKGYADAEYVNDTTAQTIAGIKTFSSVPVCSTQPTSNNQLANKQYVDSAGGTPSNMMTTDTTQTITSNKTFTKGISFTGYSGTSYLNFVGTYSYLRMTGNYSYIDLPGYASRFRLGGYASSNNFPMEVSGPVFSQYSSTLYGYNNGDGGYILGYGGYWTTLSNLPNCARFHEGVVLRRFYIMSDERIKKNITDIDDDEALQKLRLIEPKKYQYKKDDVSGNYVYGFIAQQIKSVIDDAVNIHSSYIPSICEFAVIDETDATTSNLSLNVNHNLIKGDKIKCVDIKGVSIEEIEVIEVIDDKRIKIDKIFTKEQTTADVKNMEKGGIMEIFENIIYIEGKEVDDFHSLNKDTIWTLTTASVQEIDRQQQADKLKIKELSATLSQVEARLSLLEAK